jgi:hypothetical protein
MTLLRNGPTPIYANDQVLVALAQSILYQYVTPNWTIYSGTTAAISSGQEQTCGAVVIQAGATLMNMGYLRCSSFQIDAGGNYIAGPGSTTEIYSGY